MIINITSYLQEHREIKVISLDVFDTLLFRTAYTPADIFGKMYEFEPGVFPENVSLEDWSNARRIAEKTARKKKKAKSGNFEVTLEAIYQELPTVFEDRKSLMQLEIKTEKKCCFLNESLYKELKKAVDLSGCKIVLCSDMYLDSKTILSILGYNGFDISLVSRIFVSCEWDASKRYERLFQHLLEECRVEPQEVLHLGDDYYRDVSVAKYLGLHAIHYNLISDSRYHYPFIKMEELSYGSACGTPCNELYTIRLLASKEGRGFSRLKENGFWYDLGAMIYGPFLTYAMEWVLDQAEQQNISVIRPFMREGDFLCQMLQQAARERTERYSIEPLYISRFAIFTSLFGQVTEREVEYFINTYNVRVKDIFTSLHIEDEMNEFEVLCDKPVNELRDIAMGECSAYDILREYLTSSEILGKIRKRNTGKADQMLEYFQNMGLFEACITLDLGWRGSMQKALDDVLKIHGIENHMKHLLCICNPRIAVNMVNGSKIQGYMGNLGRNQRDFSQLSVRLFELVLLSTKGTTVSYQKVGRTIEPVVKHIPYPDWQIDAMKQVQEGILSFQSIYLKMVKKKPHLKRIGERPELLCSLIGRLHAFPLYEEAEKLSTLLYDQNFGANIFSSILDSNMINDYRKSTFEEYYERHKGTGANWYSGLNVQGNNRLFYVERHLQMNRRFTMLSIACLTRKILQIQGEKEIVLVQAGNMTKIMLYFLAMADEIDTVAGIVDNDPRAVGGLIGGIEIYPVEHRFQNPLYVFTTIRAECYIAISEQLKSLFGSEISMIGRED